MQLRASSDARSRRASKMTSPMSSAAPSQQARAMTILRNHPNLVLGGRGIHHCPVNSTDQCYGEPNAPGLLRLLQRWPHEDTLNRDSLFYDIGSGFGRLSAFLSLVTNASVRGIEINECRYKESIKLQQSIRSEVDVRLDFRLGDARTLGFADATHCFLASTCWSPSLLSSIFEMAIAAPRLRSIIILSKRLPTAWNVDPRLSQLASSWGHVVAVNAVPTSYGGASAFFIRRGRCIKQYRSCWSWQEASAEADRQAQLLTHRTFAVSRTNLQL